MKKMLLDFPHLANIVGQISRLEKREEEAPKPRKGDQGKGKKEEEPSGRKRGARGPRPQIKITEEEAQRRARNKEEREAYKALIAEHLPAEGSSLHNLRGQSSKKRKTGEMPADSEKKLPASL